MTPEGIVTNFRSLVSTDVWRDLIDRGRPQTYPYNSVLLAQGESPDCVIALVDGLVKVAQSNEGGDHLTLMLRGPGEVLGEMGALLNRPRSATVTAARRCTTVVLAAHAFRGYVERHRLETVIYQLTVERLNSHERLRADLVNLPSTARVARVVSLLADEIGRPQGTAGLLVELGMPRTELATMAAMRRSSVLSALGELQSAGILRLGRRRLVITDLHRLRTVACGKELLGCKSRVDTTPAM
ncbi:Crp/Fnr family transcriptional regulator [Streptomyces coeruleorubidus]|uniref:Crp/Fnr family transcriptional regulator n=1 Tax=Streptomyces coeruleorubidus TaxID=116188 RepID=UPI0033FD8E7E